MLKRTLDVMVSATGLLALLPFFAVTAVAIKATSSGPVFFRQERVGLRGKIFRIFKFRTMKDGTHRKGSQVTSRRDSRITPIGAFLRRHKLDEYPQLINVLLGDMSLVGPRPEVPRYVSRYPEDFARLCRSKPGMTHKVSLMLRHEEEILAGSNDPEELYINSVLPWKLGLYLSEDNSESVVQDIATIYRTVFLRDKELRGLVPSFDSPEVTNIPLYPVTSHAAAEASDLDQVSSPSRRAVGQSG